MKNSQENTLYENHIEIVKTIIYIYIYLYLYSKQQFSKHLNSKINVQQSQRVHFRFWGHNCVRS